MPKVDRQVDALVTVVLQFIHLPHAHFNRQASAFVEIEFGSRSTFGLRGFQYMFRHCLKFGGNIETVFEFNHGYCPYAVAVPPTVMPSILRVG